MLLLEMCWSTWWNSYSDNSFSRR